jgi:hypothetical protein
VELRGACSDDDLHQGRGYISGGEDNLRAVTRRQRVTEVSLVIHGKDQDVIMHDSAISGVWNSSLQGWKEHIVALFLEDGLCMT